MREDAGRRRFCPRQWTPAIKRKTRLPACTLMAFLAGNHEQHRPLFITFYGFLDGNELLLTFLRKWDFEMVPLFAISQLWEAYDEF